MADMVGNFEATSTPVQDRNRGSSASGRISLPSSEALQPRTGGSWPIVFKSGTLRNLDDSSQEPDIRFRAPDPASEMVNRSNAPKTITYSGRGPTGLQRHWNIVKTLSEQARTKPDLSVASYDRPTFSQIVGSRDLPAGRRMKVDEIRDPRIE